MSTPTIYPREVYFVAILHIGKKLIYLTQNFMTSGTLILFKFNIYFRKSPSKNTFFFKSEKIGIKKFFWTLEPLIDRATSKILEYDPC